MAYRLTFSKDDSTIFTTAYEGFLLLGRPSTREEHKASNAILDKFEAVSTADPAGKIVRGYDPADPVSPKVRHLNSDGGFEIFEDNHYRFLKDTLDKLQGPPPMSRLITKTQEWMDTAKQGDAKKLTEEAQ